MKPRFYFKRDRWGVNILPSLYVTWINKTHYLYIDIECCFLVWFFGFNFKIE